MGLAKAAELNGYPGPAHVFASNQVTRERLAAQLDRIGALQAQLRAAHLEAHLEQARILTPEQTSRYAALRGYSAAGAGHRGHGAGGQHKH